MLNPLKTGLNAHYLDTIQLLLNLSKGHTVLKKTDFKVLHLSTSHAGGAGIAALRLHRSLLAEGVDSHFLALESKGFNPRLNEVALSRSPFKKVAGKLSALMNQKLFQATYFTIISAPSVSPSRLNTLGFDKNTVLHIHNWFNLLSTHQMRRLLEQGYRIVVTLHDQRFFTGGCHYSLNCDEFVRACRTCVLLPAPSLNVLIKRNHRHLHDLVAQFNKQIVFLAPSYWIFSEAKKSSILKKSKILYMPNLHSEFEREFNYKEKSRHEEVASGITIGVASMDSSSPLKGGDFVPSIVGVLQRENQKFRVKYLSQYSQTEEGYSNFWKEINCLLVLSRADNSPNVIHEAKIANVPIIGTRTGGIPELLNESFDFIIENDNNLVENVALAISSLAKNPIRLPQDINLRYRFAESRGHIEGFLETYSEINRLQC